MASFFPLLVKVVSPIWSWISEAQCSLCRPNGTYGPGEAALLLWLCIGVCTSDISSAFQGYCWQLSLFGLTLTEFRLSINIKIRINER